jgi:2-keto-4-pentenoate hydratase/2-oxohepta-3-ene-1,7-dioic acid hydratase in catechol pathway
MAGPVTRIIRFLAEDGKTYYGEEPEMGCPSVVVLSGDVLGGEAKRTQQRAMLKKLLAPVLPTEIFCIGLNYMKHFEELSKKIGVPLPTRPVLFMKPVSTLAHPGDNIWLPSLPNATVDYEVELVLVISKDCRNVSRADWKSVVCGYTVANDVSSRHWQREAGAGQWIKGKSFDTFCPLGPVLVTKGAIPDPTKLRCNIFTFTDENILRNKRS